MKLFAKIALVLFALGFVASEVDAGHRRHRGHRHGGHHRVYYGSCCG
jgi:hypothetical protein